MVRKLLSLLCCGAALVLMPVPGLGAEPAGAGAELGGVKLAYDERAALETSLNAIGRKVGSYRFADHKGRSLRFAELAGKPLVVSMVFTGCYQTCPLTTLNLLQAVRQADREIGAERYTVATIGFDTRADTPERMAAYAHGQGIDRPGWLLLSTDGETIKQLAGDLGFSFFPSPRGFDHLVQTSLLDGEGRIYRQLYGTDISANELIVALRELTSGKALEFTRPDSWIDRLRLFCSVYDPNQGRYRFDFSVVFSLLIGGISMLLMAVFLVRAYRSGPASTAKR